MSTVIAPPRVKRLRLNKDTLRVAQVDFDVRSQTVQPCEADSEGGGKTTYSGSCPTAECTTTLTCQGSCATVDGPSCQGTCTGWTCSWGPC